MYKFISGWIFIFYKSILNNSKKFYTNIYIILETFILELFYENKLETTVLKPDY